MQDDDAEHLVEAETKGRKKRKSPFYQGDVKPYPGSIFVRKGSNRIYVEYKKTRIATGLPMTKANIQVAIAMVTDLWREYHGYPTLRHKPIATSPYAALEPASVVPSAPVSAAVVSEPVIDSPVVESKPTTHDKEEKPLPTIADMVTEYTDRVLPSRDIEDKTAEGYAYALDLILHDRSGPATHENIVAQLNTWLLTADSHYSGGGVNAHLRGFRTFTTWLRKEKRILEESVSYEKLWRKRDTEAEVFIYDRSGLIILIHYYETCEPPKGYSDGYLREMAELLKSLLAIGTRIKETLLLEEHQFANGRIAIPNKITRKIEYLPLTDEMQGILDRVAAIRQREEAMLADPNNKLYIPIYRQDRQDDVDRSKRIFRWSEESISSLLRHVKKTMILLGLDVKGGWHTFRRTFADELHQADVDLHTRQKLLRHQSPETTAKFYTYTHADRLKMALEKAASRGLHDVEDKVHIPQV